MSWGLHSLLVATLPYLPKRLVRLFARRYIPGETEHDALVVTEDLNRQGFEVTLDILGEHVQHESEAAGVAAAYVHLYHSIAERGLRANVSLKPTHLGLDLGFQIGEANLVQVLDAAAETDNFMRLDMEDSRRTDDTLVLYRDCLQRYPRVGPVLQAYLHRSRDDLAALMSPQLNVRLCKGIYLESPDVALQDEQAIRDNYLALVHQGFEGGAYLAIATHDRALIDAVETHIRSRNIPPSRFEFQVLYGVPMAGKLEALLTKGYTVRVYLPFGETWYDYSLRRLQENPNMVRYILRNLLRK